MFKQDIRLPQGTRPRVPPFKPEMQLPEQNNQEVMAGGIEGLADPINPVTRKLGFLSVCRNMVRSEETAAETRPGKRRVGNAPGTDIIYGLGTVRTDDHKELIAVSGDTVYSYDGSSWSEIDTGLTEAKWEMAQFRNRLIMTNGKNNVKVYDPALSSGEFVDLAGSPPKSPYIAVGYQRAFLVDLPNQVVVSDTGDEEEWSGEDSQSFSVAADDGDEITWIAFYQKNLYVWKRGSVHEFHGPETGRTANDWQNFRVHNVGTPNGRTVVEIDGLLYWLSDAPNNRSVVAWAGGDQPEVISDPIRGLLDRINWDYISTACAGHDGKGHYMLSVPIDDSQVPNYTLVMDVYDRSWWVWTGYDTTSMSFHREEVEPKAVMGDNTGNVSFIDAEDDWGEDIPWEVVVGPAVLGSATYKKRIRRAYVVASGRWGQVIYASTSDQDNGPFNFPYAVEFPSDYAVRVRQSLPLREDLTVGGYVYRLKLTGEGVNKLFEVGFDVGVRGI